MTRRCDDSNDDQYACRSWEVRFLVAPGEYRGGRARRKLRPREFSTGWVLFVLQPVVVCVCVWGGVGVGGYGFCSNKTVGIGFFPRIIPDLEKKSPRVRNGFDTEAHLGTLFLLPKVGPGVWLPRNGGSNTQTTLEFDCFFVSTKDY